MTYVSQRAASCNRAYLFRALQRLPDADFEKFVRAERKRRRQATWLIDQERDRWRPHRGLTRNDRVGIMRRSEGWQP
jgi:hypothetical protein